MNYMKPLPQIDNILWLTKLARPFPATAGKILKIAEKWHFNTSTLSLLRMFPADEEFKSGNEFLNSCEVLEELMREERDMQNEILRSPQG